MREIKLRKRQPRFQCDFCNRKGVFRNISKHESICWNNPNRFCPNCNNTGKIMDSHEQIECVYCSKRWNKEDDYFKSDTM